jgi:AmmeMemoRadiSam system protein A/AmmeMemoRadiSam system protein B
MAFDGASVYSSGNYITPLGPAPVNREIARELQSAGKVFRFPETSHVKEHSIEVQIPLLQYYFREMPPIVPIIIGTGDTNTLKKIASALSPYFIPENLFVISSDFSHYPPYREAVATDRATAGAIISGDAQYFLRTLETNEEKHLPGLATSMCGWTSGLTLMYLAGGDATYEYRLIDYCNSGDSPYGNKNEVVGYNAIALIEKEKGDDKGDVKGDMSFSENEASMMFAIARSAIVSKLNPGMENPVDKGTVPAHLNEPYGAFVTLKIGGQLRGCIGRFISAEPLCEVIKASAISSAFEDPRFLPLTAEEYRKTSIEITVLGPMKKIENIDEIILGRHGIYVKNGNRAGTMLPQVATENGWSLEQFLGYTSRDKAGLGWDGWKTSEIYIYEGKVLGEQKH